MRIKKSIIILLSLAILAVFALSFSSRNILYYENYALTQIDVSSDSIQMIGWFCGASGIGYDGFDYAMKEDTLYLKLYEQSIFSSKPLNGSIEVKIDGDFTKLKGIYLVQPKGRPIHIWP